MIHHDLHIHTPYSNCGRVKRNYLEMILREKTMEEYVEFSRLRDMLVDKALVDYIRYARSRKIKVLGFADHYNITTDPGIFKKLLKKVSGLKVNDITILVGTETDIINNKGEVLVPPDVAKSLDFVIAGQHHYTLHYVKSPPTIILEVFFEYCLTDIINTMRNPLISAIAHPWLRAVVFARARIDPEFKLENIPDEYFFKTCEYAERYNKPLQIDYNPLWETGNHMYRGIRKYVEIILEYSDCKIFYGSDAHRADEIGRNLKYVNELLEKYKIDSSRIWIPKVEQ